MDDSTWALSIDLGKVPRRTLRRLYPNRSRTSRTTDFTRWRPGTGGWWFAYGRSLPTKRIAVGHPKVFELGVYGMHVGLGYVNAIDVPSGAIWVTP